MTDHSLRVVAFALVLAAVLAAWLGIAELARALGPALDALHG